MIEKKIILRLWRYILHYDQWLQKANLLYLETENKHLQLKRENMKLEMKIEKLEKQLGAENGR
jgi:hypothetical protein